MPGLVSLATSTLCRLLGHEYGVPRDTDSGRDWRAGIRGVGQGRDLIQTGLGGGGLLPAGGGGDDVSAAGFAGEDRIRSGLQRRPLAVGAHALVALWEGRARAAPAAALPGGSCIAAGHLSRARVAPDLSHFECGIGEDQRVWHTG